MISPSWICIHYELFLHMDAQLCPLASFVWCRFYFTGNTLPIACVQLSPISFLSREEIVRTFRVSHTRLLRTLGEIGDGLPTRRFSLACRTGSTACSAG